MRASQTRRSQLISLNSLASPPHETGKIALPNLSPKFKWEDDWQDFLGHPADTAGWKRHLVKSEHVLLTGGGKTSLKSAFIGVQV